MTLRKQKFTPSLFQVQNGLNKNHSWPGNDLCRSDFPAACFWLKCLTSHWTVSLVSMSFCLPSLLWFIVLIYLVLPGFPSLTLRIPGNEMYSSWHADAQPCGRCDGRSAWGNMEKFLVEWGKMSIKEILRYLIQNFITCNS